MADETENAGIERRIEGWIGGVGAAAVLGAGIGWGGRAAARSGDRGGAVLAEFPTGFGKERLA